VPVYEIMWKNIVEPDRPQMTIWRIRSAHWIPKNTNTHSECVIQIVFLLQQWLHERASMLGHTYIACIVINKLKEIHVIISCIIFSLIVEQITKILWLLYSNR